MGSFAGKTAVVTGASAGVGKATVLALAAEGARVYGIARRAAGLATLGGGVETIQADAGLKRTARSRDPLPVGLLLTPHSAAASACPMSNTSARMYAMRCSRSR